MIGFLYVTFTGKWFFSSLGDESEKGDLLFLELHSIRMRRLRHFLQKCKEYPFLFYEEI